MRILVVDDDASVAEVLVDFLEHHGFEPVLFRDPLKAASEFTPGRFNIALLDHMMPGLTGAMLAEVLFEKDPGLPVLLVTAFPEDFFGTMTRARRIVRKPFSGAELLAAIRAHAR